MYDARLINVYNGTERQRAIDAIRDLQLGTHKVLIARVSADDALFRRYCAMERDIAKSCEFTGRRLIQQQWRVLLVSGHAMAIGEGAEIVHALEGEFCNLRESTKDMHGQRLKSLVDYTAAWGDDNGVRWSKPRNQPDQET